MLTEAGERPGTPVDEQPVAHAWVAAALVGVGHGSHDRRAARAARTGRYVVPANTRIEVLEVYCARCRAPYDPRICEAACPGYRSERADAARGRLRAVL